MFFFFVGQGKGNGKGKGKIRVRGEVIGAWCFGLMTCVRPTVDQWSCSGPAQFCTADVDQPRPSAADGHLPKLVDPP